MGLVSAVVAGFEVTALVEVNVCGAGQDECSGAEQAFIGLACCVIGASTFVIVEAALEYGFVMRELHYGHKRAWDLLGRLRAFRRVAEWAFVINLVCFLLATIAMLHVRFAPTQSIGAYIGISVIGVSLLSIIVTVAGMQYQKFLHVQGCADDRLRDEEQPPEDAVSSARMEASGKVAGELIPVDHLASGRSEEAQGV